MSDDAPIAEPTPGALLAELWTLQLKKCIAALKEDKPSAAALDAARKFLADSNVTLDTLPQLKRARRSALEGLTLPFSGAEAGDDTPAGQPEPSPHAADFLDASDDHNI